jgi:hypothetical protein
MKPLSLCLLCFFAASPTVSGQESKDLAARKDLRRKCHAHFYYTAALAEEDDKSRMKLLTQGNRAGPNVSPGLLQSRQHLRRQGPTGACESRFPEGR